MLYYLIHVIACCHMSIQHLMCTKKNQTLSDSMLVHMVQDTFNTLQEERVGRLAERERAGSDLQSQLIEMSKKDKVI